jgi:hypothetical protein
MSRHLHLPCGGIAHYDHGSGIGYRCECGAVVGSIGMPKQCSEEAEKWITIERLGGRGWDYVNGRQLEIG